MYTSCIQSTAYSTRDSGHYFASRRKEKAHRAERLANAVVELVVRLGLVERQLGRVYYIYRINGVVLEGAPLVHCIAV